MYIPRYLTNAGPVFTTPMRSFFKQMGPSRDVSGGVERDIFLASEQNVKRNDVRQRVAHWPDDARSVTTMKTTANTMDSVVAFMA